MFKLLTLNMKKFTKQKVKDVVCVELFHSQKLCINEDSFFVDKNAHKRRKINHTNENACSSLYNDDTILINTAKQNFNFRNKNFFDDESFSNLFMQKSIKNSCVSQCVKSISEKSNERFFYDNNSKEDECVKIKSTAQTIYDKETREIMFSKPNGNRIQEDEINSMKNVQSKNNIINLDQDVCIRDKFYLSNVSDLETKVGNENKKLNAMYSINALDFQASENIKRKENLEGLNFNVINSDPVCQNKLSVCIDSANCGSFVKPKNSSNFENYSILSFNTEDLINSSLYFKETNIKKDIDVNNNNYSNNTNNKKGINEDTKISNFSWLNDEFNDKIESKLTKNESIKEINITLPIHNNKNLDSNDYTHNNSTLPINKNPDYKKRKIIDDNNKDLGKHYKMEDDFNSSEEFVIESNSNYKEKSNNQDFNHLAHEMLRKEDLEMQKNNYFKNNESFNQNLLHKEELKNEKINKGNSNESAYFDNILDNYEDTINKSDISFTHFLKEEIVDCKKTLKNEKDYKVIIVNNNTLNDNNKPMEDFSSNDLSFLDDI